MSIQTDDAKLWTLSQRQAQFIDSDAPYLDLEGAVRSAKTWALVFKTLKLLHRYPGIHGMLSRYMQDALDAQLRPEFYKLCPPGWLSEWIEKEDCQTLKNGSRVYLRALKSSEQTARYAKFRGLTLGFFGVDQAEELPSDIWQELKARTSQPGTPQQRIVVANPPGDDHWLAKEFPDPPGRRGDHELIRVTLRDNPYLDPAYVTGLEAQYPLGHPLRRRNIDGERGLGVLGDAVYGRLFLPAIHLSEFDAMTQVPLLEAWDFGLHHPAVLWAQWWPGGRFRILGEYLGSDVLLPDAIAAVDELRRRWFPANRVVWRTGDPAGKQKKDTGASSVQVLSSHGWGLTIRNDANTKPARAWAISQAARLMSRRTTQGEAFGVHERCRITADALQAGYVRNPLNPNEPLKDGYYDHLMNCLEYLMIAFGGLMDDQKDGVQTVKQLLDNAREPGEPRDRIREESQGY